MGVPRDALGALSPSPQVAPPQFGGEGVKQLPIEWRNWPKNAGRAVLIGETRRAFAAEFDLENGAMTWISFDDPTLIEALGREQRAKLRQTSVRSPR